MARTKVSKKEIVEPAVLHMPFDESLERGFIGSVLREEKLMFPISKDCFYSEGNRKLYEELSKEETKKDILTTRTFLMENLGMDGSSANSYILSCTESDIRSQERYGKELERLRALRDIVEISTEIQLKALAGEDISDIVSNGVNKLETAGIEGLSSKESVVTTEDFYSEYYENIERLQSGEKLGFETGIRVIDENCDGLQPGTVMRLNAYSNIGKTRLAVFIMSNLLKQGVSCVFYSTEVTASHFFPIYASSVLGLPFRDVKEGKVDIDWDYLDTLPFKFYQDKFKLDEIVFTAKKHKPQVVFIDFAQNIDAGHLTDEYKNMSLYAREIQKFAITNNIAVFDLSQVSNEGAKMGGASNVIASKGSGALVASADVGLLLTRESFTPEATILKLDIKKNKYGPLASAELAVDYRNSNYQEFNDAEI